MFFDSSIVQYKRNLLDLGAGYFIPVNAEKTLTANLYTGIATGKYSFHDDGLDKNLVRYNRYHESIITKWYVQPSINFLPLDYFRISLATKVSFVHYGKIRTSYTPDELEYFSLNAISNKTITFFEPSFDFQVGLPSLPWLNLDFIFSTTSNYHREGSHLNVRGSNFSLGLNFNPSRLKRKK